eukprot:3715192-Amphidinium_carterae.1
MGVCSKVWTMRPRWKLSSSECDEAQMDAQQLGVHVGFAAVSAATGVLTSPVKAAVTSAGL